MSKGGGCCVCIACAQRTMTIETANVGGLALGVALGAGRTSLEARKAVQEATCPEHFRDFLRMVEFLLQQEST